MKMSAKALLSCTLMLLVVVSCTKDPSLQDKKEENQKQNDQPEIDRRWEYSGQSLETIVFPIGGIGTGNIGLGGRGNIESLEIFNRPWRGQLPEAIFAIWARQEGKEPVSKVLERELLPHYSYWHGVPRTQLGGLPRFDELIFRGEYPYAWLQYVEADGVYPLDVKLEAYNPFIPLDPDNSGLPIAIFNWRIANNTADKVSFSIALRMKNPIKSTEDPEGMIYGYANNEYLEQSGYKGVMMTGGQAGNLYYGQVLAATTAPDAGIQTRSYRGGWFDDCHIFWDDFSRDGKMKEKLDSEPAPDGEADIATITAYYELEPGESVVVPYYLSWRVPTGAVKFWYHQRWEEAYNRVYGSDKDVYNKTYTNLYAVKYKSPAEALDYFLNHKEQIDRDSKLFHDVLFSSSYPQEVIGALAGNMASIKTNLLAIDENKDIHAWEGLQDKRGSCQGTCNHVWNYEQTFAYLFPSLEQKMREISFLTQTEENGFQRFRISFPLGDYGYNRQPAADGQMGNIIRVYREWKLSGNTAWMLQLWPYVKKALEFAWKGVGDVSGEDAWMQVHKDHIWDIDKDGVMEGRQHNTYDIDFFGPNTMVGSLYLAALKAASEMAVAAGDMESAKEYKKLYEQGSAKYDSLLWNGEYYIQKVEVPDGIEVPEELVTPKEYIEEPTDGAVPKYQYGEGCLSDQLLGQYLAFVSGLGYVLDQYQVDQALYSIYKYNYKEKLSEHENVQRIFALNDEAGLLLCTWPKGDKPLLPFVYSDEVWTGIEYQVAASLIYAGHIKEGLDIVKAVRDRYAGYNRNPWSEIECGQHYARAMASWAVMLALSGYQYDGVDQCMVFDPQVNKEYFSTFWSNGRAWGAFSLEGGMLNLTVFKGQLKLRKLGLGKDFPYTGISKLSQEIGAEFLKDDDHIWIIFPEELQLSENSDIQIYFEK